MVRRSENSSAYSQWQRYHGSKKKKNGNISLYRDDELGLFRGQSRSEADNVRKEIVAHFKTLGLDVAISCNLKSVNFSDLTLRLDTGKHNPYRKPNNTLLYIHRQSNHPPSIKKSLPAASRRLTDISSDENVFDDSDSPYNDALQASGYTEPATYICERKNTKATKKSRRRGRKITWYNPPYNMAVKTKIGAWFISLLNKHLPLAASYGKCSTRTQSSSATAALQT